MKDSTITWSAATPPSSTPRTVVAGQRAEWPPVGAGPYPRSAMIRLDAATFLLQWAVGGLLFLWVTTRRREVGIGYGWLLRGTYLIMAVGAIAVGHVTGEVVPVRDVSAGLVALATTVALM